MIHAPVPLQGSSEGEGGGPLPVAEIGDEAAGRRLRRTHLRLSQARARAAFAGFFALSAAGAALLVAAAMLGAVDAGLILAWLGAVGGANFLSWRRAMAAAERPGLSGWDLAIMPVLEAGLLAALWSALPVYAFATQAPHVQVVIGGAMAAMIMTAIALAAVPAAAMAWVVTLTLAFALAFFLGSGSIPVTLALTFVGIAAVSAYGVARMTRWAYQQLKRTARASGEAESIRLLLREYEHHGVGWLWQIDDQNRIVYVSSRMAALIGRGGAQLLGHSLPAALGGNARLGAALVARAPFTNLEMDLRTRTGTCWISLSGDPIVDPAGHFQGYRGVGLDITEAKRTQERLTSLAQIDLLSGLPNRTRVRQLLAEALLGAEAGSAGEPCALMFLDLDEFKPVNDTFGHPKGDAVLKSVARRLVQEVGDLGQVGRMGGDEFAVVLCNTGDRSAVERIGRRIIAAIAQPFLLDRQEIRIGVSIGCAFGPADAASVDDLIQKADLALYQAKAKGRGAFCFFNAAMQNEAEEKQRLERDLREALERGEFRLVYQPLVDSGSQKLLGFEALVRWHHPGRGMVSPLDFIPLAEETGLILPLGEWVVKEACRALAQWRDDIFVAVNVSARQLVSSAFPGVVREALSRSRIPADRLELEVTESVFMGDTKAALETLQRLRALGLGIALDDFGTGYSSLGYLNKAVFHKLKIDGSFVREAVHNQETVSIIQAIVALARSFRMKVTAEGVETMDDFARMRELGCHQIQGYLFGKPMSFDEADVLVKRGQAKVGT